MGVKVVVVGIWVVSSTKMVKISTAVELARPPSEVDLCNYHGEPGFAAVLVLAVTPAKACSPCSALGGDSCPLGVPMTAIGTVVNVTDFASNGNLFHREVCETACSMSPGENIKAACVSMAER